MNTLNNRIFLISLLLLGSCMPEKHEREIRSDGIDVYEESNTKNSISVVNYEFDYCELSIWIDNSEQLDSLLFAYSITLKSIIYNKKSNLIQIQPCKESEKNVKLFYDIAQEVVSNVNENQERIYQTMGKKFELSKLYDDGCSFDIERIEN